jgi:hypothetical protein
MVMMMEHGDVLLKMNNQSFYLKYDWRAINRLINEIGPKFDEDIAAASAGYETPIIATALSVGLDARHPGQFTVDELMKLSPPLIPSMGAVNDGLMIAFYGSTDPPDDLEKKTPIRSWILSRIKTIMRI